MTATLPTLTVTTEAVTSTVTPHYAWRVGEQQWAVSWLPGRGLTLEQAQTAVLIAELVWGTREPAKHITAVGLRVPGVKTPDAVRLASQAVFFGAGVL